MCALPPHQQGVTTVRNYGKVRFWQKVRYGITGTYGIFRKSTVRKYGIIFSVPYAIRTPVMHALHFCFQVLHFSFFALFLLAYKTGILNISFSFIFIRKNT